MNTNASNPMHADNIPDDPRLPSELLAMHDALERLGAMERAAAGDDFEARVFELTRPGLPLGESVETLAHADRTAASPTLEDRIFVATRGLLKQPERVMEEAAPATTYRIHTRSVRWLARVAAVVAVGVGASLVYMATRPAVETGNFGPDKGVLARNIAGNDLSRELEGDFQNLGAILAVALGGAESETASATDTSLDEMELPRLDFLNNLEGSI